MSEHCCLRCEPTEWVRPSVNGCSLDMWKLPRSCQKIVSFFSTDDLFWTRWEFKQKYNFFCKLKCSHFQIVFSYYIEKVKRKKKRNTKYRSLLRIKSQGCGTVWLEHALSAWVHSWWLYFWGALRTCRISGSAEGSRFLPEYPWGPHFLQAFPFSLPLCFLSAPTHERSWSPVVTADALEAVSPN